MLVVEDLLNVGMKHNILIVDDEAGICDALGTFFQEKGCYTEAYGNVSQALHALDKRRFDVVITDFRLPDMNGLEFLKVIKQRSPSLPVIVITAYGEIEGAVECIKEGAFHYVQKPFNSEALYNLIAKAVEISSLEQRVRNFDYHDIVWGKSGVMDELRRVVTRAAKTDSTCFISGETGSGKEVVARAVHDASDRRQRPFVAVNCAALTETLLESELFGHEKGAFTGADKSREGRFELASGGTILLDEVTETSPAFQGKLLRVLQEKRFEKVGSSSSIVCDVRVIATTNRNVAEEIRKGRFRQDLYFRLNVIPITVPPLREHPEDIEDLVARFLAGAGSRVKVTQGALKLLKSYHWPGNIRELKNIVERAVALSGGVIDEKLIGPWLTSAGSAIHDSDSVFEALAGMTLRDVEDRLIKVTLKRCGGNKEKAAKMLGITSRTLYNRLAQEQSTG